MSEQYPTEGAAPTRRLSPVAMVGIGVAALVLAVAGATGGWLLAEPDADDAVRPPLAGTEGPSPSASAAPSTTGPAPSTPPASTPPPAGQVRVPDLTGVDFTQARRRLRGLRLGWQLVFADSGKDRTVGRTEPPGGTTVRRGTTVTVYVQGAAPAVAVPSVVGLTCRRAAEVLVEQGLYPEYPTGRAGRVGKQDPAPPADLRWNDRVRLYCEASAPTVTPSPSP